jgi:hypothetical protein
MNCEVIVRANVLPLETCWCALGDNGFVESTGIDGDIRRVLVWYLEVDGALLTAHAAEAPLLDDTCGGRADGGACSPLASHVKASNTRPGFKFPLAAWIFSESPRSFSRRLASFVAASGKSSGIARAAQVNPLGAHVDAFRLPGRRCHESPSCELALGAANDAWSPSRLELVFDGRLPPPKKDSKGAFQKPPPLGRPNTANELLCGYFFASGIG